MIVGFTGTRIGMSEKQILLLKHWLQTHRVSEAHHGDCIGADEQFHKIVKELGIKVIAHPGALVNQYGLVIEHKFRAYTNADIILNAKPFLERNKDIVDICDILLAAPYSRERLRSGTWYTIKYARIVGKPVIVFWRDGFLSKYE